MEYIRLMRPKHYIKNFLFFLPLLFSGDFCNVSYLFRVFLGFVCFCFLASSIYIINDINDVLSDKAHDVKKRRPIASGRVSVVNAYILFAILLFVMFCFTFVCKFSCFSILLLCLYFLLNLLYSLGFKNIPLVDIMILVSGFFIRVLFGASVLGIEVSSWLYLTVVSVSFYLGLGKRRNEFITSGCRSRAVLKYYSKDFFDKNMYVFFGNDNCFLFFMGY